jgi:hypothetical protein
LLTGTVSRHNQVDRPRLIRALDGSDLDATLGPCGAAGQASGEPCWKVLPIAETVATA